MKTALMAFGVMGYLACGWAAEPPLNRAPLNRPTPAATAAGAPAQPLPAPAATVSRDNVDLAAKLNAANTELDLLRKRVDDLEKRLGESRRYTSPFDTLEKRLEEIEDRIKDLERGR